MTARAGDLMTYVVCLCLLVGSTIILLSACTPTNTTQDVESGMKVRGCWICIEIEGHMEGHVDTEVIPTKKPEK